MAGQLTETAIYWRSQITTMALFLLSNPDMSASHLDGPIVELGKQPYFAVIARHLILPTASTALSI